MLLATRHMRQTVFGLSSQRVVLERRPTKPLPHSPYCYTPLACCVCVWQCGKVVRLTPRHIFVSVAQIKRQTFSLSITAIKASNDNNLFKTQRNATRDDADAVAVADAATGQNWTRHGQRLQRATCNEEDVVVSCAVAAVAVAEKLVQLQQQLRLASHRLALQSQIEFSKTMQHSYAPWVLEPRRAPVALNVPLPYKQRCCNCSINAF